MKNQLTSMSDGSFTGKSYQTVTNAGDEGTSVSQGQRGYQSENAYTQYGPDGVGPAVQTDRKNQVTSFKRQMTQEGWDGSFVGIRVPSPTTTDGDNGGSQLGSFQSVSFEGFNLPGEASGPVGPDFAPGASSNPTSGQFPGVGDAGKGPFGSRG